MSVKVYFRTADSKAIAVNITNNVNYQRALQTINNKFKIPKEYIRLIYNGQNKSSDFKLNPQIPHHIIHVLDKRQSKSGPVNVSVTVNNGRKQVSYINVQADSKTSVKQFVNNVLKQKHNSTSQNAQLFHLGKKLAQDTTFEDHQIGNNAKLNIMLQDVFDPEDVEGVTAELKGVVPAQILFIKNKPTYSGSTKQNAIHDLGVAGFFIAWQQQYEVMRANQLYEQFGPYVQWDLIGHQGDK